MTSRYVTPAYEEGHCKCGEYARWRVETWYDRAYYASGLAPHTVRRIRSMCSTCVSRLHRRDGGGWTLPEEAK